jgi:hypothetical protein
MKLKLTRNARSDKQSLRSFHEIPSRKLSNFTVKLKFNQRREFLTEMLSGSTFSTIVSVRVGPSFLKHRQDLVLSKRGLLIIIK